MFLLFSLCVFLLLTPRDSLLNAPSFILLPLPTAAVRCWFFSPPLPRRVEVWLEIGGVPWIIVEDIFCSDPLWSPFRPPLKGAAAGSVLSQRGTPQQVKWRHWWHLVWRKHLSGEIKMIDSLLTSFITERHCLSQANRHHILQYFRLNYGASPQVCFWWCDIWYVRTEALAD